MIRLDFHANFNREGGWMNSTNEQDLRAIEVGTWLNSILFGCFLFMLFVFI
jgi:hypothetical protein